MRFKPRLRDTVATNVAALRAMGGDAPLPEDLQRSLDSIPLPKRRVVQTAVDIDAVHDKRTPKAKKKIEAYREKAVVRKIKEWAHTRDDVRLWRNASGQIILDSGARITYGVGPNGASDFIGYCSVVITPEMVGTVIAQFVAVEAKAEDGVASDAQVAFIEKVRSEGAIALFATSAEQVAEALR